MIDTYDEWNQNNPINQEEDAELTEMQQLEYYNWELFNKLKTAKKQVAELIELAEQFENKFLANKLKQIRL
jgi:hypothetical protein